MHKIGKLQLKIQVIAAPIKVRKAGVQEQQQQQARNPRWTWRMPGAARPNAMSSYHMESEMQASSLHSLLS